MNKNTANDFLPLVKALAEGKTIQYLRTDEKTWKDTDAPAFGHDPSRYRIKPSRVECWSIVLVEANLIIRSFTDKKTAEEVLCQRYSSGYYRLVRLVEET